MPSRVWERLQKGGSLLGDPEERMMAEGQDGSTPGSGLVKVWWGVSVGRDCGLRWWCSCLFVFVDIVSVGRDCCFRLWL